MMYFGRLKATLILGSCLLGMLLGVPNLFPAPAAWVPWRTVHLGLDLRGGSYLLLVWLADRPLQLGVRAALALFFPMLGEKST